ncbi:hypothetical protein [Rugosimonospora africana]|uniref:Uncharacterized protein n=1 Tax=Rugosimonospora africana TaxID=556532 RepID=A0A8J3VUX1_9ACTN|nr:hypothetical protein [Rugosimonospora africana]GIH19675.1 hypothetical protein Raf01_78470 [Rugosimonospora africana]
MDEDWQVNGLPLPDLLVRLLKSGRWQQPGDEALRQLIPWFHDPLDFMLTLDELRLHNRLIAESADTMRFFCVGRGSAAQPIAMPWLDLDQAVYIAICRYAGDDIALALDYRSSSTDPRVLATDTVTLSRQQVSWRQVTPTLSEFVDALHLRQPNGT